MRKRRWNISAVILSTTLVMGSILTGCGSDSTESSGSSGEMVESGAPSVESVQGSSADAESSGNANGLPIVSEKETFTIAVAEMSSLKSAAEKQCVIDAEEATNIHIEWIEIPSSAWEEKINIMFSTGDLPDAIIGSVNLVRNYDQLVVLNDYLESSAPNVMDFFDTRDDYPNALYLPDGTIRSLPTGDETAANSIDSMLWINQTWLDELGLDMPTNVYELKEVLIAFRDGDPNGNGSTDDEIPFTFQNAWGWGTAIENFFGPFGIVESENHVFMKDNTVIFSARQQGYYDALVYLHELYEEKLIDKDVFTLSSDQYGARGAADGTVEVLGLVAGYRSTDAGVLSEDNYVALPLVEGPDGTKMVLENSVSKTGGFSITSNCKNPEALVRWYDYLNSSLALTLAWDRGEEGVFWEIREENGEEFAWFIDMSNLDPAFGGYTSSTEYRAAESFAGSSPSLWRLDYFIKHQEEAGINTRLLAIYEQLEHSVISLPEGMAVTEENAERRSILLTDIDTYLEKFIADSVINGIDETKWQTHLKALEDLKVDEYTALCQEYVDGMNGQ